MSIDDDPHARPSRTDARTEGGRLIWSVKGSLLRYVADMHDGSIETAPPATAVGPAPEAGFAFPEIPHPGEERRFDGSLTLTGHGGLLTLVFAAPGIRPGADGWALTIADPHAPGERLVFATVERLLPDGAGGQRAEGTRLSAAGADLFFAGPYTAGSPLDDPRITADGADSAA